jgi:two-component system, OmpR family, sensor kinase
MTNESEKAGIALLCDLNGTILKVIRDELGLVNRLVPGKPLSLVVDRGSLTKALDFLFALKADGAVFDWELGVPVGDAIKVLHFAGARSEDDFVVVGANTEEEVERLLREFVRMSNEQTNRLRGTIKENVRLSSEKCSRESGLYDELGRLNNELANLQRELAKKNVDLERLNEEKNRFLGIAAHDLRNPLNAIQMYSEFLLEEATDNLDAEQMEFVSIIHTSSQFMLQLVNDLLDVAKIEAGKLELNVGPGDLVCLAKNNVKLNATLASRKDIRVEFDHSEPSLVIMVDEAKMEQVLNNLISNAVKFSSPGSSVRVRVEKAGSKALVSVEDQGQGIPAEEWDSLFRPFQKTSVRSTGGEESTGLGLAIVHKIVQGHDGRVWVESEVGKGSKFFVELPLLDHQLNG